MLSKNKIKYIQSFQQKKQREKEGYFIAEGKKIVSEILSSDWEVKALYASEFFFEQYTKNISLENIETCITEKEELKKISCLKEPDDALVICKIPTVDCDYKKIELDLVLYLDGIRDPGNLGSIIRVCDWFGIKSIFCSKDTTELYNPKTIQSTMGSFLRVNVFYENLVVVQENMKKLKMNFSIYGACVDGESIYASKGFEAGILVIGNEANGISIENKKLLTKKISIPSYTKNSPESLNAAIATSIIISEYKRQNSSA